LLDRERRTSRHKPSTQAPSSTTTTTPAAVSLPVAETSMPFVDTTRSSPADEIDPYQASVSMFEQAQSPKYLLTIDGGSHHEVFVDPPWEPPIAQSMVAFHALYVKHDPTANTQFQTVANQPGLLSLQAG
jgi:hypothetical protein